MVVVLGDGTIKKDTGAGTFGVTLASGLTVSGVVPVFVEGGKEAAANNRKLFIFTGSNAVQVLSGDGATTAAVATPPADWSGSNQPTFGLNHEGRVWGGGNANDPHRLYYSMTTNHEDFTGSGSGSLAVFPGEGEKLVQAISFKGLVVCWKYPRGIYLVDTTDPTVANWKISRLTLGVGGHSPQGACVVDDDIAFLDSGLEMHLLSSVQEFGDFASKSLTRDADLDTFMHDNFNKAQTSKIRAIYYSDKREAHFAVAGAGSTTNNAMVMLDLNSPTRGIRFHYSDRDTCESVWLRKDTNGTLKPVHGDASGFVWLMDQATKSKDGAGYSGAFQTPYMDFSWADPRLGTQRKIGQFLECVVEPLGNWNLSVGVYWDGELVQTVNFNMGTSGAALGSFVLGTDALAGDQILNRKRRITGSGRRLSLSGSNSGAGEDFSIGRFYLHAMVGDERPGRDND